MSKPTVSREWVEDRLAEAEATVRRYERAETYASGSIDPLSEARKLAAIFRSFLAMHEALEFYADESNYVDFCPGHMVTLHDIGTDEFEEDNGHVARAALDDAPLEGE